MGPRGRAGCQERAEELRKNVALLVSVTAAGFDLCLAVECPTAREVFEDYLKDVLASASRAGQQVV